MIIINVFQFWELVRWYLHQKQKQNWRNDAGFFPTTYLGKLGAQWLGRCVCKVLGKE